MAAIADWSLMQWFPADKLAADALPVQQVRRMILSTPPEGYLAICAAVPRLRFFADQSAIRAPTLIVAGERDPKLSAVAPDALSTAIPGAKVHMMEAAGHLPNIECPEQFSELLLQFLRRG